MASVHWARPPEWEEEQGRLGRWPERGRRSQAQVRKDKLKTNEPEPCSPLRSVRRGFGTGRICFLGVSEGEVEFGCFGADDTCTETGPLYAGGAGWAGLVLADAEEGVAGLAGGGHGYEHAARAKEEQRQGERRGQLGSDGAYKQWAWSDQGAGGVVRWYVG